MIKIFIYGPVLKKNSAAGKARAEYIKRLSRIATVTFKKLPAQLPEDCIVFFSGGDQISSPELAQRLSESLTHGSQLHLVLADDPTDHPQPIQLTSLPLSEETESVLLLEQIYRAFKIMAKEPYHK
ncbi:MAG: 23S rRNA (pseudouridine(1915)-N(3))-methyltransferase RlmH [Clostridiaceae bacterium]